MVWKSELPGRLAQPPGVLTLQRGGRDPRIWKLMSLGVAKAVIPFFFLYLEVITPMASGPGACRWQSG